MLGFVIGAMRREPGAVQRRRREITRWTRAGARIAAAGAILALPVTNAAPAAAVPAPGTFAYVANGGANTVSVVDTKTNLVTDTIDIPGVNPTPVATVVNQAGTKLYVINNTVPAANVSVIDTTTHALTTVTLTGQVGCIDAALNPAGTRLYIACSGTNLVVMDTTNNNVSTIPLSGGVNPRGVAVNPDGTRVYTANLGTNDATVIDTSNNNASTIALPGANSPGKVAVNPTGTRAYVTNGVSSNVSVINTAGAGTQIQLIATGSGPIDAAVSPDGTRLYVTVIGPPSAVVVFNTTATPITVVGAITTGIDNPRSVAFNPAGTFAYVTNLNTNNMAVIDTVLLSVTDTVPGVITPFGVAVGAVPGTGSVPCPGDMVVTGGGAEITGPEPSNFVSKPADEPDNAWEVSLTNPTNQDITIRPYALCSDPT
ncbi:beta-propeller fold lactonase family protein [Streptomyces sp. NPDC058572]|uniref:beta-propeller fold lactonase family protein n=1 Tax=Streptomyces sp. NPDC058572 TaxID=3346546 RepID=UPI00365A8683